MPVFVKKTDRGTWVSNDGRYLLQRRKLVYSRKKPKWLVRDCYTNVERTYPLRSQADQQTESLIENELEQIASIQEFKYVSWTWTRHPYHGDTVVTAVLESPDTDQVFSLGAFIDDERFVTNVRAALERFGVHAIRGR